MDTAALKKFAQGARALLIGQAEVKLTSAIDPASIVRREHPAAMKMLDEAISAQGRKQVAEQVAYTWFNRLTALRFMDANGYTIPRVVSPDDGATRPEILSETMAGNLPVGAPAKKIADLLEGDNPSHDPQGEAYRLLLVHACNSWHDVMPFMFEKVGDYTELLMPDDLLSPTSILSRMREVMTEEACKDVEIIGWLYQFYISEKKDQVFAGLKKNQKITPENIPAATQLFTPHWIVRYLVENSLGRLWLLNRPWSKLAERMDYYIAPEDAETDFLKISKPQEIRVCDPACGSAHMLTYAFDLLFAIYEEEGFDPVEIPALILANNLTGVEIDDRAGALASFALAMKAAAKLGRRRFLRLETKPDIVVLHNVTFTSAEMQGVAAVVGRDRFSGELCETLGQFEQAKNFGSLIVPKLRDPAEVARVVRSKDFSGDLLLRDVQERVLKVLEMAEALSPKYHVVVANPPYMGSKGMNAKLNAFIKLEFKDDKQDVFSAFTTRISKLSLASGYFSLMTPFNWMFLSSFEKFRENLLRNCTITSLVRPEFHSFFDSAYVSICGFCCINAHYEDLQGIYIDTNEFYGAELQPLKALEAIRDGSCTWRHTASSRDFHKISGSPIAYWLSEKSLFLFGSGLSIETLSSPRQGLATTDNNQFVRLWQEISHDRIKFDSADRRDAEASGMKWFPYNKGGEFRRWYGNNENIVNWENDGKEIKENICRKYPYLNGNPGFVAKNQECYFQQGITWTYISSSYLGARLSPSGFVFDVAGSSVFPSDQHREALLLYICSSVASYFIRVVNPTLNIQAGSIGKLPITQQIIDAPTTFKPQNATSLIDLSKSDWDAYETSWDFTTLPLLAPAHRAERLAASYATLRAHWQGMTDDMQRLEEENNRIFIDAYGLKDELTPEVPVEEITLTCNPAYRYGGKATAEELETRLRADTMAEFLHYAVGCMFGRYSLDASGLILANQGEGLADYLTRIPDPTFTPDADNVIPVLDGDWFADDIVSRARDFIRLTFGEAKFRENLAFVEDALGKDLRKWFTKDFFEYHTRRYKKRPIYWMFSSPKGTFNALIYMHRYRPETLSVVLNDYLREFIRKLESERTRLEKLAASGDATQVQSARAEKDLVSVKRQISELINWERDVVFPLAQEKNEIDLDEGVKRNYPKFGPALKPIKGLEDADG